VNLTIINPNNNLPLRLEGGNYVDDDGNKFPVVDGVTRIVESNNCAESFGVQWNKFDKTQLDHEEKGLDQSRKRFFAETHWDQCDLVGKRILEVGSGAGRFSKVVLECTNGILYSFDYSNAVTANFKNNGHIAPDRFHLFQSSIYGMPFPDNSFDKVFCFGVLQHTPSFDNSIKALASKAIVGGEIVVDFYPIKGWWTKISAKYMLRPITKRMAHDRLLGLIERNIDGLINLYFNLHRMRLGVLTRFLPVCNIKDTMPDGISKSDLKEWAILDTFDQYSPEYDNPQRLADVVTMFERNNVEVTFAGLEEWEPGRGATVVRGIKRS